MALLGSPNLPARPLRTAEIMRLVMIALLPGIAAQVAWFGPGVLLNIVWGAAFALAVEAGMVWLRNRSPGPSLRDGSALVTALLLAAALPPAAPWWLIGVAAASAIAVAKHLYGGLGYNPFNPAMVGYVVVLIAFPLEMSAWVAPDGVDNGSAGLVELLRRSLGTSSSSHFDAVTAATPLDLLRQNDGLLMADLWSRHSQFGRWGGTGWEWVNLGFLAGGLLLVQRRIVSWHAPAGMVATLVLLSAFFYDGGSSASGGSPLLHLLSGGTMLGAFFILTDPVTAPVSTRGRLIGGALVGLLIYTIRSGGDYPDGVAFGVLLMNFAAPFIDRFTRPRAYGESPRRWRRNGAAAASEEPQ